MSGRQGDAGGGGAMIDSDSSRPATATTAPVTAAARPSDDVRKRMDDIFAEMEQQGNSGRFHLPPKFVQFYKSDVMFLFVRAVVGYAVAFVKALTLEDELRSVVHHHQLRVGQDALPPSPLCSIDLVEDCRQRLASSMELRSRCAFEMAAAYSRLVLHCSNFENHKEDERFFECVYLFSCSVAKLSVSAVPTHWRQIEEELGFLFRGAQFSSTVKSHARAGSPVHAVVSSPSAYSPDSTSANASSSTRLDGRLPVTGWAAFGFGKGGSGGSGSATDGGGNAGTSPSSSQPSTAASSNTTIAKILSLSPTTTGASPARPEGVGNVGGGSGSGPSSVEDAFELPKSRISSFPESVPVKKIVSDLEATKSRAARNMEIAQTIRDQIAAQRADEQRRRMDAVVSPRQLGRVDGHLPRLAAPSTPSAASCSATATRRALLSPRISMKSTFVTRSPALNHLLPTTEERVRIALEGYERELQERRRQGLRAARPPPLSVDARKSIAGGGGRHHHTQQQQQQQQSRSQSA